MIDFLTQVLWPKLTHAASYWLMRPFSVFGDAQERLFLLYIVGTVLFALAVLVFAQKKSLKTAFGEIFNKHVLLHRSTFNDLKFFYVNTILYWLVLIPLTLPLVGISSRAVLFIIKQLGFTASLGAVSWPITVVFTLMMVLAADLGIYIAHRLQHRVPLFWEFHKMHHSAEVMTPITEYRIHPVDDSIGFVTAFILSGLVDGVFRGLFSGHLSEWTVWGVNVFFMVFYATAFNLRHSHVWIDFGPRWSKLFLSPAQHQIHHSDNPKHFDRNFGQFLGIWDWAFGSIYIPKGKEPIQFGLGSKQEHAPFQNLRGLYFSPLLSVWRLWIWRPKPKAGSPAEYGA